MDDLRIMTSEMNTMELRVREARGSEQITMYVNTDDSFRDPKDRAALPRSVDAGLSSRPFVLFLVALSLRNRA
jgi:hypothetical protein